MFITEKKLRRNLMWMEMERTINFFVEECRVIAHQNGYVDIDLSYENNIDEAKMFLTKDGERYQVMHINFHNTVLGLQYPGDYVHRTVDMIIQIMGPEACVANEVPAVED